MEYVVKRNIEAGKTYRINSSYGYAGISNGMIVVDRIVPGYDPSIKKDVLNWMEIHSQSMNSTDPIDDREAILADLYGFAAEPWVYYTYTSYDNSGIEIGKEDSEVLPINIFVDHISCV